MNDTDLVAKMYALWSEDNSDGEEAMTRVLALVREHDVAQLTAARAQAHAAGWLEGAEAMRAAAINRAMFRCNQWRSAVKSYPGDNVGKAGAASSIADDIAALAIPSPEGEGTP